jgi:hypothetical protein
MVLHPECSCSSASLEELARVLASSPRRPAVVVAFVTAGPAGVSPSNPLWAAAALLPDEISVVDPDGQEAAGFGARVSGQTYFYNAARRLVFEGGLTAARGHAGDNDGEASLAEALSTGVAPLIRVPVFGCALGLGNQ